MSADYDVGSPALRVKVYEGGRLVTQVMCESAQEAADAAAEWEERPGYECVVEDLAVGHGPEDVLGAEPEDVLPGDDDYPEQPM